MRRFSNLYEMTQPEIETWQRAEIISQQIEGAVGVINELPLPENQGLGYFLRKS
ncbi:MULTISPECIES: hypothetical protein [unclassified Nostoc]|uniref:hypothetical protein n=1 Tax=unclassified Nostoc TaxID=2593658 RepID=UPI00167CE155|nr:hypothetical protein [Nostoc sp. 'Peltigera membranacea cyanobiont' 213]